MPRVPPSAKPKYDVGKLKEAIDNVADSADEASESLDDMPDPNYECMTCGFLEHIEDHQVHTPNWCKSCDDIKTFEKL